jgi:hypothetical protein
MKIRKLKKFETNKITTKNKKNKQQQEEKILTREAVKRNNTG